jgi:hypothetical protein
MKESSHASGLAYDALSGDQDPSSIISDVNFIATDTSANFYDRTPTSCRYVLALGGITRARAYLRLERGVLRVTTFETLTFVIVNILTMLEL